MSQRIVGLDIGHYSVKALTLSGAYSKFTGVRFDEVVRDRVVAPPLPQLYEEQVSDWEQVSAGRLHGLYSATLGKLKVVIQGREVTSQEVEVAMEAVEADILGLERPLSCIAYLFMEPAHAEPWIAPMKAAGVECWAMIEGAERRLDIDAEELDAMAEALLEAVHDAEEEALYKALEHLVEEGVIGHGESSVVAMPPDLVMTARMAFPFTDDQQLRAVVPSELEDLLPVKLDTVVTDLHIVGPSVTAPMQHDVLVASTANDDLSVHLDLWQKGGVDPQYVVLGDAAMLHLAVHLLPDAYEPFAIVDIGHRYTRVAIMEPGPPGSKTTQLSYSKTLQYGGDQLTSAIADVLGLTYRQAESYKHSEAFVAIDTLATDIDGLRASDALKHCLGRIVRELRTVFLAHYSERRVPVAQFYLCGGTSRLPNLDRFLAEELGVPCEHLPVASNEVMAMDGAAGKGPIMAQALALGLREVLPKASVASVNFRRGRFRHVEARSWFKERAVGIVALVTMLLMCFGGNLATRYYAVASEADASGAALATTVERLWPGQKVPAAQVAKKMKVAGDKDGLLPEHSAYEFYFEVASRIPQDPPVELYVLDVDIFRMLIKIEGQTASAADVDAIASSLEEYKCFKGQVQKGDVGAVGDQVKFTLTVKPQCSAPSKDKKKKGGK